MRVYTSLPIVRSFKVLFGAVYSTVPEHGVSGREQLLLTLVKLAHNLSDENLAFTLRISQPTVSRYFHTWIEAIYL